MTGDVLRAACNHVDWSIMSVFMDLNLDLDQNQNGLKSLIETAAHLGFSTVAVNYVFEPTTKKKQNIPSPTPINELIDQLPIVQGRSRPIRVLNRLTIMMSDASHYRPTAPEYRRFDLLAVHPTTEKLFHAACMMYDIDLICISVMEKLPFFFKRAPVNGAVARGVAFEVSYSSALRDATLRRYTIANASALVDSCKGKNIIVSSAARKFLELRGPYDVANLSLLFGLSDADAKDAISSMCRSVVLHAERRKSAGGIIHTMKSVPEETMPTPDDHETPAAKKARALETQ